MTGAVECRYYGRDFTVDEMALLRALIATEPQPNRAGLSREFCRRIGWLKPDGGLKDMMARVVMLAMHKDGLIELPPPKGRRNPPRPIVFGPDTEPPLLPAPTTLDEVRPLEMRPVVRETREGRLWNEFVARYHYLGFRTLVGAQMRYAVHDRNGWPRRHARLLHRRLEARTARQIHRMDARVAREEPPARGRQPTLPDPALDRDPQPRLAHPRHRAPTPAHRLDRALQHHARCSSRPSSRPRATPAPSTGPRAGSHVGTTQGRGRYDRDKLYDKPRKDVWLRPLRRDWQRTLNR